MKKALFPALLLAASALLTACSATAPALGSAGASCDTTTERNFPTPLLYSVRYSGLKDTEGNIRCLLESGADPNAARQKDGWTPLMQAAFSGYTGTARLLLAHGAHVDATNIRGVTALQLAAGQGHTDIVRLLLDKGANPNIVGAGGQTALRAAAFFCHADATRLLLGKGANPNVTDINGDTALSLAQKRELAATKEAATKRERGASTESLTAHANDCKAVITMLRAAGAKK